MVYFTQIIQGYFTGPGEIIHTIVLMSVKQLWQKWVSNPDSKVHGADLGPIWGRQLHGANLGPIWGRQDPGGSHVGPMNFAIWEFMWIHQ